MRLILSLIPSFISSRCRISNCWWTLLIRILTTLDGRSRIRAARLDYRDLDGGNGRHPRKPGQLPVRRLHGWSGLRHHQPRHAGDASAGVRSD